MTTPGFGLRVTEKGMKTWTVMYRSHGQLRRVTLGHYPDMPLKDARDRAREMLRGIDDGEDPAAAKAEERRRDAHLFQSIVAEFIERHAKPNNRGWARQDRDLRREFLPQWSNRPIGSIGRRDILEVLDRIADRTSPRRANRYLALVKKLFAWCVDRGYIEASPAAGIKPPAKEVSRDRVLSDDELRLIWRCCKRAGWPFGDLFRLLIVTGQRLGEVSAMRWGDIALPRGCGRFRPPSRRTISRTKFLFLRSRSQSSPRSRVSAVRNTYFRPPTAQGARPAAFPRPRRGWTGNWWKPVPP
jgi:integrase